MSPFDRRLLTRIALRMERDAKAAYEAAGKTDSAKSTRDNVMGDVLDLRDYIARMEEVETAVLPADATLVPREATDDMATAGVEKLNAEIGHLQTVDGKFPSGLAKDVWSAMIRVAAPVEKTVTP